MKMSLIVLRIVTYEIFSNPLYLRMGQLKILGNYPGFDKNGIGQKSEDKFVI